MLSRDWSKLGDDGYRGGIFLELMGSTSMWLISSSPIIEDVPNLNIVTWSRFVCCGTLDMFLLILVFSDHYPFLLWNTGEE
jgi:hypothetical protein